MKTEISGNTAPSFTKTTQGPLEPYTDFLPCLKDAVFHSLGDSPAANTLLQVLAFENANPECQKALHPLKASSAPVDEFLRACAGIGRVAYQAEVLAAAI